MTKDTKGDLFGRVVHGRTGDYSPDPKQLHEPFRGPGELGFQSVAYRFCTSCGRMGEVNEKIGQRLAQRAGTPFDGPAPSGIYFETDGCPLCGDRETRRIEVKLVPALSTDSPT